jgi:hypothetical protein
MTHKVKVAFTVGGLLINFDCSWSPLATAIKIVCQNLQLLSPYAIHDYNNDMKFFQ